MRYLAIDAREVGEQGDGGEVGEGQQEERGQSGGLQDDLGGDVTAGQLVDPEGVLGEVESHPGDLVDHGGECQDDPGGEDGVALDKSSLATDRQGVKVASIEEEGAKDDVVSGVENVEDDDGDQEVPDDIIEDVVAHDHRKI